MRCYFIFKRPHTYTTHTPHELRADSSYLFCRLREKWELLLWLFILSVKWSKLHFQLKITFHLHNFFRHNNNNYLFQSYEKWKSQRSNQIKLQYIWESRSRRSNVDMKLCHILRKRWKCLCICHVLDK